MAAPSVALRQLLLAAQVIDEVDLELTESGIVLTDGTPVAVRWSSLLAAAGGAPLDSAGARIRVVAWLRMRRLLADLPLALLHEQLRAVGLPVGHALHPGRGWACHHVLGGTLELGPGLLGLDPADPDGVAVVPPSLWRATRLDPVQLWASCSPHLERMGELAARRWARDGDLLRPMGGCDVVTLLGAATLRARLSVSAGGMRTVVVPMRTRGWTSRSRLDPAFARAAAAATDPEERGFARPVLVTADEVVLAPDGPDPMLGARDEIRRSA